MSARLPLDALPLGERAARRSSAAWHRWWPSRGTARATARGAAGAVLDATGAEPLLRQPQSPPAFLAHTVCSSGNRTLSSKKSPTAGRPSWSGRRWWSLTARACSYPPKSTEIAAVRAPWARSVGDHQLHKVGLCGRRWMKRLTPVDDVKKVAVAHRGGAHAARIGAGIGARSGQSRCASRRAATGHEIFFLHLTGERVEDGRARSGR